MSFFRLPEYVAETRRQCGLMLLCLTGAAGVAAAASALGLPVYSTLLAAALLLLRVLDHLPGRAQGKATGFASSREALETRANMAVPDAIRLVEHLHYTRELAAKVRDTLLAQQADHAIDRLRTAKERVGVPPNPAARDGTRLVQLCRPTQVNAVLDGPAAASDEAGRAVQSLEDELQRLRHDPHFAETAAAPRQLAAAPCAVS